LGCLLVSGLLAALAKRLILVANPEYRRLPRSVPLKIEISIVYGPVARSLVICIFITSSDSTGKDILDQPNTEFDDAQNEICYQPIELHPPCDSIVDCREPFPNDYYRGSNNAPMPLQTIEALHFCTPVPRMGISLMAS